jgi:hypothetical protein
VRKFSEVEDCLPWKIVMHGPESRAQNVVGLTATSSPCPQLVQSFCVNFVSDSGDSYLFSRFHRLLTPVPSIR